MTRVLTTFIETSRIVWAIAINAAFRFRLQNIRLFFGPAGYQWITNPSWRAHTLGIMIFNATSCRWGTRIIIQTRVNTSV